MITIYNGGADDFTGLGMGALDPLECLTEEEAGGMYELTLKQPIDEEHRDWLIDRFRIIKAPASVRESPIYEGEIQGTVNREVYRVTGTSVGVRLRTGPGTGYKRISTHRNGTLVAKIGEEENGFLHVCIVDGGAAGYMSTKYLTLDHVETETITGDTPGTVVTPVMARNQLFRIDSIKRKSKERVVEVHAEHITYDLKGVIVEGECKLEKISARSAIERILAQQSREHPFNIHCYCDDEVSGEYGGRNLIDCMLNAEDGIAAQIKARVVRDNFDIYILPGDSLRDMGAEIRYGKNMIEAEYEMDDADIVTQIRPAGKTKKGEKLYIDSNGGYVDSPRINSYPIVYTKEIEYDVQVGKDGVETKAQAIEKLIELANADFASGIDGSTVKIDAEFVREEITEEYKNIANEQALHMYDIVHVRDHGAGTVAALKMTRYVFDCLTKSYKETETGEITELEPTVYSYELGGISGTKIASGTLSGDRIMSGTLSGEAIIDGTLDGTLKLRDLSIGIAKIDTATIDQLNAAAIAAIEGNFDELLANRITAGMIQAGQITADKIAAGQITADKIAADSITANKIQAGAVEAVHIKSKTITAEQIATGAITAEDGIISTGAIGTAQIADGSITDAKIVDLTASKITAGTINGANVNIINLKADNITTGTLNGKVIPTLGTEKIEDGAITGLKIYNGSITTDKIDDGAVTAAKVVASAITAEKIAAEAVTTNKIVSGAITADKIGANAVTANKIDVDNLFADDAFVDALTTSKIFANGDSLEIVAGNIGGAIEDAESAAKLAGEAQNKADAAANAYKDAVTKPEFERVVRIDTGGMHIGDNLSNCEVLIDSGTVNIVVSGQAYSTFGAGFLQLGDDVRMRRPKKGGVAFCPIKG